MLKVPVYLTAHTAREAIEEDGVRYTFVVDDIAQAVHAAKADAGDKDVALLGGSISRQCLKLGLVDEMQLHVVSLFGGLGKRLNLERIETAAFAGETTCDTAWRLAPDRIRAVGPRSSSGVGLAARKNADGDER